ncbi:MAG: hypothetical protein FJX47_08145 [Alphaproteobacteria bacterium]|nr:hypothetical protein [Alphaproteobacteria bacterium]
MRKDEIDLGAVFQQRNVPTYFWEVRRLFEAVDGRRYCVLARKDSPADQKTLALSGLRDGGQFRRVMPEPGRTAS